MTFKLSWKFTYIVHLILVLCSKSELLQYFNKCMSPLHSMTDGSQKGGREIR